MASQLIKHSPLVVLIGETASGKTELAIKLAQRFNGEIICADSWTVRREVNIGTAKPTLEQRSMVPHHLLDVAGPDEDFTAAVFKGLANKTIEDITSRGKLPIMVGGTGLYVNAVIFNYGFLPAGDRTDREELNQLNLELLLARIKDLGLDLGDVDTQNKRRLIRLIETRGAKPASQPLRKNTLLIGISPDRETLNQRITDRTDAMMAAGLEDEVQGLVDKYGWDCEALKGISYAQWRDYFNGTASLIETRQMIIKATLDLAKRQRTWFKKTGNIKWFPTPVNWSELVVYITTFMTS